MNLFQCKGLFQQYLDSIDEAFTEKKLKAQEVLALIEKAINEHEALDIDTLTPEKTLSYDAFRSFDETLGSSIERLDQLIALHGQPQKLSFLRRHPSNSIPVQNINDDRLQRVRDHLKLTKNNLRVLRQKWYIHIDDRSAIYKNFRANNVFMMSQALIPAFGSSHGECYGLVFEYAISRQKNKETPFHFRERTTQIQARQFQRQPEGAKLYPERLTKIEYEPDLLKQAEGLIKQGKAQQGKHLHIGLRMPMSRHATYLQFTNEGKWHYFDPNHGAYEFDSAKDFKRFYKELYSSREDHWHSYGVSKLIDSPPKPTWAGKIRSVLTGSRYANNYDAESLAIFSLMQLVGLAVGLALVYTLPISFSPLFLIGVSCGAAVVAGSLTFIAISELQIVSSQYGFQGLLAIPRMLHYKFLNNNKFCDTGLDNNSSTDDKNIDVDGEPGLDSSYVQMIRKIPVLETKPDLAQVAKKPEREFIPIDKCGNNHSITHSI